MALPWKICVRPSSAPTSPDPKARSTARISPTPSQPTIRSPPPRFTGDIVVAFRNGAPVKISDLADVVDGLENTKVGAWYRGQPAIVLDVQRQPGANVIETVQRVRTELPRLRRAMPAGADLTIVNDRTTTIRASIHDVQFTLVLSIALVVLVVLIFLRTIRATIIAGVALPALIDRDFRRDVVLRVLARQPVSHGPHDRHGLCGRRRHRHDREHRASHGRWRRPAAGGPARRKGDRVHGYFADDVAGCGLHTAALHDRPRRPNVPRIRADPDNRRGGFGDRFADVDADDVRPIAAPCRRDRQHCLS